MTSHNMPAHLHLGKKDLLSLNGRLDYNARSMKTDSYPLKSTATAAFEWDERRIRKAIGGLFVLSIFAVCIFTGRDLSPGDLCLRNLLLLIAGFKALTWIENPSTHFSFLFWIGMNPKEHESSPPKDEVRAGELRKVWIEIGIGISLIYLSGALEGHVSKITTGWIKLWGVTLLIYFGILRGLACFWQSRGKGSRALMNKPFGSKNLPEFWSQRWNRAFPYITRTYVYGPFKRIANRRIALLAAFVFSGFLHELIVSVPTKTGYGLPTLYFLIQAFGIYLVRTPLGKSLSLSKGIPAKVFGFFWLVLPLPLLFHASFITHVM